MRKRIVIIAMLLIGGAIVNVAVAWAIVARFPFDGSTIDCMLESDTEKPSQYARFALCTERTNTAARIMIMSGFDPEGDWRIVNDLNDEIPWWATRHVRVDEFEHDMIVNELTVDATGWPMLSMSGAIRYEWLITQSTYRPHPRWAVRFPPPPPLRIETSRILPLLPIPVGFAINSIFYAAILWLLFFAPGSVRRMFRRRRGLCPACAYPAGTSPVCTECGNPVQPRREAAPDERANSDTAR